MWALGSAAGITPPDLLCLAISAAVHVLDGRLHPCHANDLRRAFRRSSARAFYYAA
jgi:hypothetical protein